MEKNNIYQLPDLVLLEQHNGDFSKYLEAVYAIFKKDFINYKPVFRGIRIGLKKYPLHEGKEATFWHMISEGDDETNRMTNLRRMERIRWPAPLINNSEHTYLKVWENTRKNKNNILIFHEKEQYLVILRRGKDYLLPWTAYLVQHNARKEKLLREYEAYKNAKSAQ
jgi:hypothetical protein